MRPNLQVTPAAGGALPPGALTLSFGTAADASLLLILAGTSVGDGDLLDTVLIPPTLEATITVPAAPARVYVSAFLQVAGGPFYAYSWAWYVAPAGRTVGAVEQAAEIGYLRSKWRRTELAAVEGAPLIPDPGHGLDEICPISVAGIPWNPDLAADTAPFAPQDLRDRAITGGVRSGCGWLNVELVSQPETARVVTPGDPPVTMEETRIDITIATPSGRGTALALLYAGALASLFRRLYLRPGEAGVDVIRNLEPPPERPAFVGDDGSWSFYLLPIQLVRVCRSPSVAAS